MNKVLVEVICPAMSGHYDFWISKQLNVKAAAEKIADEIIQYEANPELFKNRKDLMLYYGDSREVLNTQFSMEEAGVISGSRLYIL